MPLPSRIESTLRLLPALPRLRGLLPLLVRLPLLGGRDGVAFVPAVEFAAGSKPPPELDISGEEGVSSPIVDMRRGCGFVSGNPASESTVSVVGLTPFSRA